MKRWFAPLVIGMVLLFSVLAVGEAGCLFMPKAEPAHAHHNPSHAGHSLFCAWACQVNPTESIHAAAPFLAGIVLVAIQQFARVIPQTLLIATVSRSRAPPR